MARPADETNGHLMALVWDNWKRGLLGPNHSSAWCIFVKSSQPCNLILRPNGYNSRLVYYVGVPYVRACDLKTQIDSIRYGQIYRSKDKSHISFL